MAEDKKSFLLYINYLEVFEALTDLEAGLLVKHLFRYVNDLNPESNNAMVKLAFITIKQQLKRDLKKWEGEKELKSDAGVIGNLKRWHLDLYKEYLKDKSKLKLLLIIAEDRSAIKKVAKIAVNDNVNVIVNDINKGFNLFWDEYHNTTKLTKSDKKPTDKYWKALSNKEKDLAIKNIKPYYQSLNNKKYCKKARTYLSDKNFNDEFKQIKKEIPKHNSQQPKILNNAPLADPILPDWRDRIGGKK